ncbi:glycosyltransferase family 4 protein, partial [Peribacillus simplex]|uniref:glycosyltransferase family 4 protein n=1 Tax=Peribacillus simplex TaxID=1478 RepID=UPI000BCB2243
MNVIIAGIPKKLSSGVRTHTLSLLSGLKEYNINTSYLSSYPQKFDKLITSVPYRLLNLFNKDLAFRWKFITMNQYILKKELRKMVNENTIINIQSVDWFNSVKPFLNKNDIKVVLTIHGAYGDQLKAKGYSSKTVEKVIQLEREAFLSIKQLVAVSPQTAQY